MANVNSNPEVHIEKGYNGFDMSKTVYFTSPTGMLLPLYSALLSPNDKVRYGVDMISRTQDLATASFARINEYVDWFFVPLKQLYRPLEAVLNHINDLDSSLFDETQIVNSIPCTRFHNNNEGGFFNFSFDWSASEGPQNIVNNTDWCDEFKVPYIWSAARLFGLLGVDPTPMEYAYFGIDSDSGDYMLKQRITGDSLPAFNFLKFAAYQKIYFDCYRLTDYETNNQHCYNLDQWFNVGFINSNPDTSSDIGLIGSGGFSDIFKIRYRPWKRDYFTSLLPSPIFSDNSINSLFGNNGNVVVPNYLGSNSFLERGADNRSITSGDNATSVGSRGVWNPNNPTQSLEYLYNDLSVANIRAMFAADKLLEVTRRVPKHYDAQTLARFGIKPPTGISGEVMRLGTDSNKIRIDQVVSSAGTDDTPLGSIGGKGYGLSQGSSNEFTAPCHGILMAVYSAVPEAAYYDNYLERENTYMKREDFYTPEFDELGMTPLFGYEMPLDSSQSSLPFARNSTLVNTVLGWKYRYSELKSKYDSIHGGFKFGQLNTWVLPRVVNYWTLSEQTYLNVGGFDIKTSLFVPPYALDNIMLVNSNPLASLSSTETSDFIIKDLYAYDPLIHSFEFHVFKSSRMSTYGLPNL